MKTLHNDSKLKAMTSLLLLTLCAATQAATPNVTLTQNASSIGSYDIYELTMSNPATYANPWEDVVIAATMTSPTGKNFSVGGFSYDGANVWKLRFAPIEFGNWTWTLTYNDGSGVFNASGAFTCVASNNRGYLRIHPANPMRFKTEADGKAFYPLGFNSGLNGALNNGVAAVGAYTLANANDFLLTFQNAGFNMWRDNCQSATPIGWGGNFNIGGSGKNKFDPVQCQNMDREAAALHAVGWKFQLCFWTTPFLNNFDLSNPQALQATLHLHQFMINRYSAYVDIWELMNEGFPTQAYMDTISAYVRAHDPYGHLITLSYPATNQSDLDVVSPHFYMSSTNNTVDQNLKINDGYYTKFNQPILYGEAGEGAPNGMYDPDRYRARIWTGFFCQSADIFWLGEVKHIFSSTNGIVNQYIGWEERATTKCLTNLTSSFDPAATPITPTLSPATQLRCYALASASDVGMYIIHANNQDSALLNATVTLTLPAAMQGVWIDPQSGALLGSVNAAAGQQTLTIPSFSKDIAIRLRPGAPSQPVLQFANAAYNVANDQSSVTLTVCRLGFTSGAVSVNYSTSDGLAKAGTAYTSVSGTLSWSNSDASPRTITVPLIRYSAAGDEEFLVNLSNPAGGAVLGTTDSAHVSLLNTVHDGASFSAPTYTVAKGSPSVTVTVNRVGNGTGPWSTYFATNNITAIAGQDFVGIAGNTLQVNWGAGDFAPKTVTIQLINNTSTGDKYFHIGLPGGGDPMSPVRARVAIIDNSVPSPGILAFSGYSSTVPYGYGETACQYNIPGTPGTAQFHVSRTAGSGGAVSVDYKTTIAGSAQAGFDYTGVNGTLTWAAGDSADKIISVPILNNTTARGTPWFVIELSNPTGALLLMPSSARINLADPNPAPVVQLVAPSGGPVAGGTAVAISGYNFISGASVLFGSNPATGVNVLSSTSIVCTTPPGSGVVSVSVTNPDGQSATLNNAFTYAGGTSQISITSAASASPLTALVGQLVTFTVAASSSSGSPLTYAWNFGDGNNGTGSSTTHTYTSAGIYTAAVTVTDGLGNAATSSVSVSVVNAPPPPPVISSPLTAGATTGNAFTYQITASNTPTSFNATGLPTGLSVNAATGVIAGTPTTAGTSQVTISATNAGGTGSATLVLTVNGTSGATTVTLQDGLNGYSGTRDTYMAASSPSGNFGTNTTFLASVSNGTLRPMIRFAIFQSEGGPVPAGVSIQSATLSLYRTTTYVDTCTLNRSLRDWKELEATWNNANLTTPWTTPGAGGAGSDIASTADATVTTGSSAGWINCDVTSAIAAFSAGGSNYGWRILSNLNVNLNTFNSREYAANATLRPKLTIVYQSAAQQPPVINSPLTASGTVGNPLTYAISASNNATSFGATGLPVGLSLNTATGVISGTPTSAGQTNVQLSATNSAGSGTATLYLTITNPVTAPVITSSLSAGGVVGSAFTYTIAATNNPTSFNATGLPGGLSIDAASGLISGTPTIAGTSNVALSATNAGGTGTATLVVTVSNANQPTTVVLQDGLNGYAGTRDTYIGAYSPSANFGTKTTMLASLANGNLRPLVRFAVFQSEGGPVPNGATIQSATLSLYRTNSYSEICTVNHVLRDWRETEATWNKANASTSWTTAGASGSGSDISASPDVTLSIFAVAGWVNFDLTGNVAAYSTGTTPNYGWKLTTNQSVNFSTYCTREYSIDPTLRPKLTVVYQASGLSAALSAPQSLSVSRVSGAISYAATGQDVVSLQGTLANVPAALDPRNQQLSVELNGAQVSFTLDSKCKAHSSNGSAALKFKTSKSKGAANSGNLPFVIKLSHGSWATLLNLDPNRSATNTPMQLALVVRLGGSVYQNNVTVACSSRAHVGLKFKK